MSSALLNKLKQSKKPKMQKTVAISISAAKPVKIKTTLLDKSGLESINRQDFMKDITTNYFVDMGKNINDIQVIAKTCLEFLKGKS